jgi:hypothetical protein
LIRYTGTTISTAAIAKSRQPIRPSNFWKYHASIRGTDLHQLGRLEPCDAEVEPAPRAVDDDAEQRDGDEHRDGERVERDRGARERLRRDVREQPHQRHGERQAERLARDACDALVGSREECHEPDADDRERAAEQHRVDATGEHFPRALQKSH